MMSGQFRGFAMFSPFSFSSQSWLDVLDVMHSSVFLYYYPLGSQGRVFFSLILFFFSIFLMFLFSPSWRKDVMCSFGFLHSPPGGGGGGGEGGVTGEQCLQLQPLASGLYLTYSSVVQPTQITFNNKKFGILGHFIGPT